MSNPTNNEAQPSAKEKALQVMAEMYDNKDSQSARPSVRDRVNEVLDSMSPSRGVLESDKEYGPSGYRTMIPADKDIIEDGVIVAKKGDMVPKYPGLMALESDLVRDLHARQAEDVQPTEAQKKAIAPDIKSQWKNKSLEMQVAENAPATAQAPKIEKPIPFERELANLRSNINQSIYRVNQSIKKEKESRFAKGQGPTLEGLKETSYRESARRTLLSVAQKIDNYNYDSVDEAGRGIVSFIDGMAESLWGAVKSTATLGLYDLKDVQNRRRVARSMQEGEEETSKETQGDIDITSVGSIIDNELKELSDGQKELYKAMLLEYSVNSLLEGKERWSRSTGEMTGVFLAFMGELAIGMGFIKAAGKTALMQSLKSGVNTMLTKAQWDVMRKMMGVSSKVTRSALKFGTTKAGKALRYVGKSAVMDAPEMTLALAPWTGLDIAEAQKPYFLENGKLTMPRGKEAIDNALNTLAMSYISNFGLKLGQGVQAEVTKNFADANKYIFQKLTQGKDIVPLSAEVIFRAGKAINNNVLSHTSLATMDFTSKAIGEMLNIAPGGITDYNTEEAVKVLVASIISGKAISLSSRLMTPREKSRHQQQMRQATLMVMDMVLWMNPGITSEQLNTILYTYQRGVQSTPQADGKVTGVLKVYNTLLKIANYEVHLEKVRYEAEKADLTKRRADLLNSKYYQSRPKELNDALVEINQELRNIQDAHIRHLNRVAEDISFIIHVKSNDYAMRYGVYELPFIEGKTEQGLQYVSPLLTEGPRSGFSTSIGLLGAEDVNIYLPSVDRTKSKVNDVAIAQLGDLVSVHIDNAPDTFNRDAVVGILQESMAYGSLWPDRGVTETGIENIATQHKENINNLLAGLKEYYHGEQSPDDVLRVLLSTNGNDYMERSITILQDVAPDGYKRVLRDLSGLAISSRALMVGEGYMSEKKPKEEAPETNEDFKQLQSLASDEGVIIPIKVAGGIGYVKSGKVVLSEIGELDKASSDEEIYYVDEKGERQVIGINMLSIDKANPLFNQTPEAIIASATAPTETNINIGTSVTYRNAEGAERTSKVAGIDEAGSLTLEDGALITPDMAEIVSHDYFYQDGESVVLDNDEVAIISRNGDGTYTASTATGKRVVTEGDIIGTTEEIDKQEAEAKATQEVVKETPQQEQAPQETPAEEINYEELAVTDPMRFVAEYDKVFGEGAGMSALEDTLASLEEQVESMRATLSSRGISLNDKVKTKKELDSIYDKINVITSALPSSEKPLEVEESPKEEVAEAEVEPEKKGIDVIRDKWTSAPKSMGVKDEIVLPNGDKLEGRYVMTEAGVATPSHNPNNNFMMSEGFPVTEQGTTINDRDYANDKAAQAIVEKHSASYDQRAVINPVVVSQEGVVYSGNDRTMAGELAAKNGTDDAYIEYIRKYGDKYGFPSEEVAKYEHPRVLFVPDEVLPYTTEVFGRFNAKETKSQNKTERAIKIGKSMQETTVNKITNILGNYEKMQDYLSNDREVREVINILVGDGMLGENEVAELYDNDRLSMVGKDYLETIFIGMALPENSVRMSTEYPSIRQALLSAITVLADNRRLPNGYALTEELEQAITTLYRARKGGVKQGEGIGDYLKQAELFSGVVPLTGLVANELALKLNSKSKTAFRDFIDAYNKEAREASQGQVSIFSGKPLTRQDIMQALITASPRFQITPSVGVYGVELTGHPESIFESNAMLALNGIKQNKATGAQWLAMLQKSGGIKAGEDKWIGLSDFLTENKERSLTRDEVAEYIANNGIRLEEVRYGETINDNLDEALELFQEEFEGLMAEGEEVTGSIFTRDHADYAFQKMVEKYGDDFKYGFEWEGEGYPRLSVQMDIDDEPSEAALTILNDSMMSPGVKPIDSTRLRYTTEGLSNKKELAFVVPTIKSWDQNDKIHFGDAGEGRSVGWVRFGDANITDGDNHQRSVLVIDEIQSNRHQEGRQKGYSNITEKEQTRLNELKKELQALGKELGDISEEIVIALMPKDAYYHLRHLSFNDNIRRVMLKDESTATSYRPLITIYGRQFYTDKEEVETLIRLAEQLRPLVLEENRRDIDMFLEEMSQRDMQKLDTLYEKAQELESKKDTIIKGEEWSTLTNKATKGIPAAPFEKNWAELIMKRMLRYAAENGYSRIAWTTGVQQADRYNMSTYMDTVKLTKREDGSYLLNGENNGVDVYGGIHTAEELSNLIGKEASLRWTKIADAAYDKVQPLREAADNLRSQADKEGYIRVTDHPEYGDKWEKLQDDIAYIERECTHSGEDLAIGGEGMKAFYDVMLPSFVNKYGKKWGVNVEDISVPVGGGITVHSVKITEEMKNGVMKPQPLFQVPDNQLNLIAPRINHERISPLIDRLKETGLAKDVILVKDEAELFKYISIADGIKVTIRGRVAAATDSNGNIVIVENNMRLDTAFHEYCHKLWSYAKNEKKESVLRGLKKIADGAPEHIKEYVRKNYPTLGYEAYLDEVFAWHTASKSQGRLQQFLKERGLDKRTSSEQLQDYEWYRQMEEKFRNLFKGMVKEFIKSNPTPYGVTSATLSHIDELSVFDAYDEMSADELINAVYDVLMSGKRKQLKDDTPVEVMNQKGTESLIAVHNITSDKLKGALSLGGLANPSMAVYDTALSSHEGFGEISFILPSEKLEGVSTFSRDAWTPKFPRVEYSFSDKARAKYQEILKPIEDVELKDAMGWYLAAYLNESGPTSSPLAPLFLQEKGIPFTPSQRQGKYRNQIHHLAERIFGGEVSKEAYDKLSKDQKAEFFLLINGKLRGVELESMSYVDAIKERINTNKQRLSLIKDNPDTVQATINMVEKRLAENEALLELAYESDMTQVAMDIYQDKHSERDIDAYGTFDNAEMIITEQGMLEEFRDWQDSVIDEIAPDKIFFSHWTPGGDRKYKPYTLDEVSKWMKKQGLNASDWGTQTGMEYFLSHMVKKMKTRSAIRKNRSMLVSNEAMREWSEKTQEIYHDAFWGVMNDGALPQRYSNDYIVAEQVAFEIMQDIIVKKRPISAVEKEYKVTLSDATRQAISDFSKEAQSAVDNYFETKFRRPVYFNEFALAVVPKDLSPALKDKLKEQGLEVREYDPTVEGHRSEVIDEAVRNREDVLFQLIGEQGARSYDAEEETTIRIDNLHVARSMEKEGKDIVSIRYATGWERGADGKWRYEIMDDFSMVILPIDKYTTLKKEYKELQNKYEKYSYTIPARVPSTASPQERERVKKLRKEFKQVVKEMESKWLEVIEAERAINFTEIGNILGDAHPLFRAYPSLRKMEVSFQDRWHYVKEGYQGMYTGSHIWISPYATNPISTLAHEIQHAIQHIEGFARGGNTSSVKTRAFLLWEDANPLWDMMDAGPEWKERRALVDELLRDDITDSQWKEITDRISTLDNNQEVQSILKRQSELLRQYGYTAAVQEILSKRTPWEEEPWSNLLPYFHDPYDAYHSLAGEVEARNVSKRINMTPEERRATILKDTEDVHRREQILLLEGGYASADVADVLDTAIENGTYLKAPNGKESNLSEKPTTWAQIRTEPFKEWFGDWELLTKSVKTIYVNNTIKFKNFKDARKWAKNEIVGFVIHPEIGDIYISSASIDKMLSQNAVKKSDGLNNHLSLLPYLPEVIKSSIVGEIHSDRAANEHIRDIVRLFGAVSIKGEIYRVKSTVKRYVNTNEKTKAYSYEVTKIELFEGTLEDDKNNPLPRSSNNSISTTKLLKGVKKNNSTDEFLCDISKIVDENGEPLIVYHGSGKWFEEFDPTAQKHSGAYDNTFYFTDNKEIANSFVPGRWYGVSHGEKSSMANEVILDPDSPQHPKYSWGTHREGGIYSVFLNMRNPFVVDFKGKAWYDIGNGDSLDDIAHKIQQEGKYDGVIAKNIKDVGHNDYRLEKLPNVTVYVIFKPEQAKSATQNVGTFDSDNPTLRFRRMFMEMTNEEIHDALNENAEYYGMGPAILMTALEEKYGGELIGASSGARRALEDGLVPLPGSQYSGLDGEYHHMRFRNNEGEEYVVAVPFGTPEMVRERGIMFRTSEQLFKEYPTWLSGQTLDNGKHSTQIAGTVKTYEKIGNHLKEEGDSNLSILDASSGLGRGTEALRAMGFKVEDVEPYPSNERPRPTYLRYEDINKKYDVVISNAVLNVIPDDWRADVLKNMADKVKVGGKLIINTRTAKEIEAIKQRIDLDSPSEVLVTDGKGEIRAYQKGFTTQELIDYVSRELGQGWQVEKVTPKNSGLSMQAAVIATRTSHAPLKYRPLAQKEPTEAQKKAGNYKMEHLRRGGYNISIENPKGSVRRGVDENGVAWENEMPYDYGYIRGTKGKDGDHIDIFLGPIENPLEVYVVDQVDPKTGKFDESKVMFGFESIEEARRAYEAAYDKDWKGLKSITATSKEVFDKWIDTIGKQGKPFAEYVIVEQNKTGDEVGPLDRYAAIAESISSKSGRKINIVRSLDEIKGEDPHEVEKKRRSMGYYDISTGEITVVLPNIPDEGELRKTITHEALGHGDIRAMLGDKADAFFKSVYRWMDKDTRAKYKGYSHKEAAEEYVAEMAETYEQPTIWARIKAMFLSILRKIGLYHKMSDADIRYYLYKAAKYGKKRSRMEETKVKATEYELSRAVKGESRYRIVGEKGVNSIAGREELYITDNLALAKELYSRGVDDNTIARSTGWERGIDGKWRYEKSDTDMRMNLDMMTENALRARIEVLNKQHQYDETISKGVDPVSMEATEMAMEVDNLKAMYEEQYGIVPSLEEASKKEITRAMLHMGVNLGELLKASKVMEEYPVLREYTLTVNDFLPEGTSASTDTYTKNIMLSSARFNDYTPIEVERASALLMHEIQHVIQEEEGFISGGSTIGVAKLKHLLKEKIDIATGRELTAQGSLVNMLANKEVMERYLPVFDTIATENGFTDMEEMVDFLTEEDYDSYARLAGEVEARRVERRRWMTTEEIKQVDEVYREEISRAVAISTQGNLMSEDSRSYRRFHLISEVNRILASTDRVSQGVKRHLVVQYIKNYLTSRDMYNFSKGDLARIMTWVEKAPTKRDFNHALSALYFEIARLGYQQSLRKVRELKKKKLEGDKNGISQARKVDASTAEFFKLFIAKTAPSMRNLSDPSGALSKELYDDSRGEPTGIEVDLVSLSEALSNNPTPEIVMRHKDAVYKKAAIELAIRYEDALDIRDMIMLRHEEIQRAWADAKSIYTRYREQRNEYDAERYHAKMEWITQQRTALSEEMANLSDEMESIARELNLILQDGIATLQNELIARENERVENIKRALLSIGSKEYRGEATRWTDKINKLGVDVWHAIYMPIFNMANTLRFISGRRYPEGKSPMWRYYVEQGMKASENYYNRTTEFARKIEDKSIEIFNLRYKDIQRRAQQTLLPVYVEDSAVEAINAFSEGGREHHSNKNKKGDPVQLSVDAALYIIGLTRNPDIAARYEARGVTETEVANIKRALLEAENGDKYLALLDWIQYDLIPSTRGRYNATFRQLNGRNMAYVVNYLPLKIRKSDQTPKQDALAGNQATARSVEETGHIKSRQQTIAIPSLTMGILEYLPEYIQKMEEWDAYSLFGRSVNDILKSKEFRNRLEANMPGMYMILAGSFQVSTGAYTPAQELNNKIYKFLEKARSRVVGANIAYNMIPAIKQLLSYPSVFDSYNTLSFYKMMVKYSNPVDNIKWVMDGHLPLLKKRWKEGLAGFQELQYKGDGFLSGKLLGVLRDLWVKKKGDLADWMLSGAEFLREKGGMLSNRAIDVFTCAMVARPVYEETYNRMVARGATETEAKKEAEFVATLTYNASQQSNERWLTSPMQSELGYGKMITTYQTTNIQQQALLQLALMELAKPSKEERENLYTKYYNDYREKGYSDEVAKKKASSDAKQDLREIKRKATINVFLYSYMMKWLWRLGGVMFSFILKGEDEEKYVDKALTPWQSLIDGAGQGSAWWIPLELAMGAWQARQEVEIRPDMLADFVNDNLKEFKDEENDWEDRAFAALNLMHTYDTGLDLRKLRNMFLSLSNMPKVLKYEKGGRDLILQMLNLSPSQRKRILMQKLEGETYEDYRERVSDMSEILYMIDIKEDAIRTKFIEKMMEEIAEDRGELDEYVGTKMYVEQTLKDKGISKSGSFNLKDKKEEMEKERENRELINRLKRNQGNMRKMTAKVDNLGKDAYESIYESYYDNLRSISKLLEVMDD